MLIWKTNLPGYWTTCLWYAFIIGNFAWVFLRCYACCLRSFQDYLQRKSWQPAFYDGRFFRSFYKTPWAYETSDCGDNIPVSFNHASKLIILFYSIRFLTCLKDLIYGETLLLPFPLLCLHLLLLSAVFLVAERIFQKFLATVW